MAVYKRGEVWWYKFTWRGKPIRESTKQGNKRIAEQIESARKTCLAKGEAGIRDRAPVPTLRQFAEREFLPHVESRFADKRSTLCYYTIQVRHLTQHGAMGDAQLNAVTPEIISGFIEKQRQGEYEVSSINRALQVLRRMLHLALEWGRVEKTPGRVSLLPGERRRERVLSALEESAYLAATQVIGENILSAYERALAGIRAKCRDQEPIKPEDPYLLRDVATILLECGLRPEECYRLQWDHVRDEALHVPYGKTANARRSIPLPARAASVIRMRESIATGKWIFPAPTKSGHIEQSTLKKQHNKACKVAQLEAMPFYTFRHTCLTRWAAHMDPYTLAYFAGHSDFGTTKRYVHPNLNTGREAMERARVAQGGHRIGHSGQDTPCSQNTKLPVLQ